MGSHCLTWRKCLRSWEGQKQILQWISRALITRFTTPQGQPQLNGIHYPWWPVFCFERALFGLTWGASCYQRMMSSLLKGLSGPVLPRWHHSLRRDTWGTWWKSEGCTPVHCHRCYADSTQFYIMVTPNDTCSLKHLSDCLSDIQCWMAANFLQLNGNKTKDYVWRVVLCCQLNQWAWSPVC